MSEILVVGSVAYDSISTPSGHVDSTLGGSANYFSLAASMYSKVNIVGVVGEDYENEDLEMLTSRNVDVKGLERVPGKTFRWEGRYEGDMNDAITLNTHLNVFQNFDPKLPEEYKGSPYVFLANIDPVLQLKVLDQIEQPRIVGVDTMNFWIDSKSEDLKELLKRVDVLLLNEGEARQLSKEQNIVLAAQALQNMGPKSVVIKRGEYGFFMLSEEKYFVLPAYPTNKVVDPTGAGDTFAGGFFGYLSKTNSVWSTASVEQACVHGCLMASFSVEDFGVGQMKTLDWTKVEERHAHYSQIVSYQK